jgi:thioredoxin-like negative regulator of GroEL
MLKMVQSYNYKAPFLVDKMKIKVLPCIVSFMNGQGVDQLIGFEGVGKEVDDFATSALEERLAFSGILLYLS